MAGSRDPKAFLSAFAQSSRALAEERNPDGLAAATLRVAGEITGASSSLLVLDDAIASGGFLASASQGLSVSEVEALRVVRSFETPYLPRSVHDATSDSIGLPPGSRVEFALLVPIVVGQSCRGFVAVMNTGTGFSPTDELVVVALALQFVTTLELIRASQSARATETRYRTLVEQLPAVTYYRELDKPGTPSFVSPQVAEIFGIDAESFARDPEAWRSRIHPDDRERVAAEQKEYAPRLVQGPICAEYRMIRDDGAVLWIRNYAHTLRDENGKPRMVMGVLFDVTRTKELEALEMERQRRTDERLREVQKMEAIGRLAGGVAHDFNNQLSVILSYASMAKDGLQPGDPLREDLDQIERSGQRARELTRQLLAVGRRQLLRPQLVDLSGILVRVAERARKLAHDGVEVTLAESGPGMARVDPVEVEHAINAVVVNAIEAMPQGGRVLIELREAVVDDAFCRRHPGLNPGAYLAVVVTDTGSGMDATTLSRSFEPFFSTKGAGRGLGLSTVFGVLHQSGGTVWVDSAEGQGSTFYLYLPLAISSEVPLARPSRVPASTDAQTVLVVEDDPQVRRLTGGILKRIGYRVLEATDGVRALHVSSEYTGAIDLLLTDVIMPQMGGRELAEKMSVVRPDTKVMFVSGYTDDTMLREGVRDGGIAFLPKPFTADALIRMVKGVLETAD